MNIVKLALILTLLSGTAFSANTDGDVNLGGRNDNGLYSSNPHIQQSNKYIVYTKIQNLRKKIELIELRLKSNHNPSFVQALNNLSDLSLRIAKIEVQLGKSESISDETKFIYIHELTSISNELSVYEFVDAKSNDINRN